MKTIFSITAALFSLASFGQNTSDKIKKINTIKEATAFIKDNPKLEGELFEYTSGTDSSDLAKKIFGIQPQESVSAGDYTYKVVETRKSYLINVFYIYLDGSKLTLDSINKLRPVIISKYNSGATFSDLAKEYNMDGNPNSDLRNVAEGMLVKDFSSAVKSHKKDEVFTIDLPDKKWYYVTKKTFDEQEVKTYSGFRIKNTN